MILYTVSVVEGKIIDLQRSFVSEKHTKSSITRVESNGVLTTSYLLDHKTDGELQEFLQNILELLDEEPNV